MSSQEICRMLAESSSSKNQSDELLHQYCKDINEWPDSWEIDSADIKTGRALLELFKLFLMKRIEDGRSKKTVKMNAGYLWVLGGELIRRINEEEDDRQLTTRDLLLKYIDDSGGPYWRHADDEEDHKKFDSVCKQLFKFLMENNS